MDGNTFVDERGVARDHEEPAQLGKRDDDVLGDAVGKIFLFRIAAHIDEGEHSNGGPIGQRHRRTPTSCSSTRKGGLKTSSGPVTFEISGKRIDTAKRLMRCTPVASGVLGCAAPARSKPAWPSATSSCPRPADRVPNASQRRRRPNFALTYQLLAG